MSKKIMVQGTASGVGKSMVATAICRVLFSDGYQVAPFKPQNMSARSFVTQAGMEIGIAQAVQAQACAKTPTVHMNPILLKPLGGNKSQIIVQGNIIKDLDSFEYRKYKQSLKPAIEESYLHLARDNDFIVIEGAGSSAELNLMDNDISNMASAELLDAPVILVADIDKGGVFASIYGTIMLQKPENRERIKGIIINKFRGNIEFLQSGIDQIQDLTKVPVLGVLPYTLIDLEEEDSIAEDKGKKEIPIDELQEFQENEFRKLEKMFRDHINVEELYNIFE